MSDKSKTIQIDKTRECLRHGEVLLVPIKEADMEGAEEVTDYIAAHSETGHNHVIEGKSKVKKHKSFNIVALDFDTKITHKKTHDHHDDLPLKKGAYKIIKKQEYDPFSKVMREVWD